MSLDRLDAVVLTGGVVEHQPGLVAELAAGLVLLGVSVDPDRLRGSGDRVVSGNSAAVSVVIVAAREDLEIARQTTDLMETSGAT